MSQPMTILNQRYLNKRFLYVDGKLYWRKKSEPENKCGWNERFSGKEAGGINDDGYWKIKLDGKWLRRHRIVWVMHKGDSGDKQIDHINGNRLDDRIQNLRKATAQQNAFNRKNQSNNPTGVKGVTFKKGLFQASVVIGRKPRVAGVFQTIEEAESAAKKLREQLHGDFANHGVTTP